MIRDASARPVAVDAGLSIAELSARRQVDDLRWLRAKPRLSPEACRAMDCLIELLEAEPASLLRALPTVPFSRKTMESVPVDELRYFVNEYTLGFGNEAAAVIVMGTEEAYDPTPGNLAVWNGAGAILRRCESDLRLLNAIDRTITASARKPEGELRPFHQYPNDYSEVSRAHTWTYCSRVLGVEPRSLGDRCYMIERSAQPSKSAAAGAPPSLERTAFLCDLIDRLPSARILLLHGRAHLDGSDPWTNVNQRLARHFFGGEIPAATPMTIGAKPQRWIHSYTSGHRAVIATWSLSWRGADETYVSAVRDVFKSMEASR